MKKISFWYEFDDEDGKVSDYEIHFEIENKDSILLEEVCEAFTRFLAAAGFSTGKLSEFFDD